MPVYTLAQTLAVAALALIVGSCLAAAWTSTLIQRRYVLLDRDELREITVSRTDRFIDYSKMLDDDWPYGDWSMDLTDYHPADRLLDPTAPNIVLDDLGEAHEVDVPHEPSAKRRGAEGRWW